MTLLRQGHRVIRHKGLSGALGLYRETRAVSLLEILISVLILSLIMVGTLNVFMSSSNRAAMTTKQNVAAEAVQGLLDSLSMDVDQSQWATTSCLGTHTCPGNTLTVGTLVITPSWNLTNIGSTEPVVRVSVTATYLAPH